MQMIHALDVGGTKEHGTWKPDSPELIVGNTGSYSVCTDSNITAGVNNTDDILIYCSERWFDGAGGFQIPVPETQASYHHVRLHFSELFYSNIGDRVFTVIVEGNVLRDRYDILAETSGATFTATTLEMTVKIQDSFLSIYFVPITGNPKISGIQIWAMPSRPTSPLTSTPVQAKTSIPTSPPTKVPSKNPTMLPILSIAPTTLVPSRFPSQAPMVTSSQAPSTVFQRVRIDAGGRRNNNTQWKSDDESLSFLFGQSKKLNACPTPILNIQEPGYQSVYCSERWFHGGAGGYNFPMPNGIYNVQLDFAELFFQKVGDRIFRILIEGDVIQDNYDIIAVAGANLTATSVTTMKQVSDGNLTISFEPIINNPKVNAIEVWKA
jgi:hypothetical protein